MRLVRRSSFLAALTLVGVMASGCALGPSEGPLNLAAQTCDVERTQLELADGVDPNDLHGELYSPLFVAAGGEASGGENCLETVRLMIEAGGDPTRMEGGDSIFLFVALLQRETEVVDYLIEQGADPCVPLSQQSRQRYGATDLAELAAERNSASMAQVLKSATARCDR